MSLSLRLYCASLSQGCVQNPYIGNEIFSQQYDMEGVNNLDDHNSLSVNYERGELEREGQRVGTCIGAGYLCSVAQANTGP